MKPSFKMMGASPAKQTTNIIGEDTYEARKNKNKDQLELGLSTKGGSSDPAYTNERLIVKPGDNVLDNRGNKLSEGGFIEQMTPITIQKDSTSVDGKDYYSIKKSPAKQKEAAKIAGKAALEGVKKKEGAKVAGKAALEGVKKLAPKAVEKEIENMLGGGASDSEIRKYVKSTGTGDKYEYNWDNVTQRAESHPLKQKNEGAVFHERIAKHVMTKDGLVPNPLLEKLKDRPQAKGYTPKSQSNDGYAYQDGVRVEDKKPPTKKEKGK